MSFKMMQFDERFIAAATLCMLGAHEGTEFEELFPQMPNDIGMTVKLESGRLAFLLHALIQELTSQNVKYRDSIMENLINYQQNPASSFGFSVPK